MPKGGKRAGAGRPRIKPIKPPNHVIGRPSRYNPAYCVDAERLSQQGAKMTELAAHFGVTADSIYRWSIDYIEFSKAIKVGMGIADDRVVRSMYERATGYSYVAEKIVVHPKTGKITRVQYTEHMPPDPTSMIFWLKNRQSKDWRDKHEQVVSGALTLEALVGASYELGKPAAPAIEGNASEVTQSASPQSSGGHHGSGQEP